MKSRSCVKKSRLWLAVTADSLELPLAVCDSQKELAECFGLSMESVKKAVYRGSDGCMSGRRYIKVEVDNHGEW